MDWNRLEGNWKQLRGRIKQQWGKLTDDDLDVIAGKKDEFLGRLQTSYGISREEAERQVNDWSRDIDRSSDTRH